MFVSVFALVLAMPVALGIAIFLTQYSPRRLAGPLAYVVDLLAAVPSIVYGVWGLYVLAPVLKPVAVWLNENLDWLFLFATGTASVAGGGTIFTAGIVLAVEAIEGTDAMLARAATLARPGPGGVLVKLVKPGQDRRADLPTIGPATLRAAAAAGLRGVAFEAGGTLLTDRAACITEADVAGLFLLGIDATSATPEVSDQG